MTDDDDHVGCRTLRVFVSSTFRDLQGERERYKKVCCTPELLVQIARTPIDFVAPRTHTVATEAEPARNQEREFAYADSGHNEIEEFLL